MFIARSIEVHHVIINTPCFSSLLTGAVLSAKSQSDQQLSEARIQARTIVHAFHKAQDKLDDLEVGALFFVYGNRVSALVSGKPSM